MEIWKDIKGYEDHYEVSSYGRVRAKYREFIGKDGKVKKYPEKYLKPDTSSSSNIRYERVTLSKNHKTKRFQVHQLVAEAFMDNPMNKPYVNHIDNNGLNNNITNLEWCTHSENMVHAQKQGRLFSSQSKGGTTAGIKSNQQALQKANSLIGTIKDKWTVQNVSNIRRHSKICLELLCTGCNCTYTYTMEYFNNSIGTACPRCRKRKSR